MEKWICYYEDIDTGERGCTTSNVRCPPVRGRGKLIESQQVSEELATEACGPGW